MKPVDVHSTKILKSLHQFQLDGHLCDTVLIAEDGQLKAHSAVLAAASPVFKASLKSTAKPVEHVIFLPGYKCYVVDMALQYIYTGNLMIQDQYLPYLAKIDAAKIIAALQKLGLDILSVQEW